MKKLTLRRHRVSTSPSLEEIGKSIEISVSANRAYFISFIVLLSYLLVIVLGTSDYQLLVLNSAVNLPFINTSVPLLTFYIIFPVIVLAVHFNLLQNLENHHFKLQIWKSKFKMKVVPRVLIQPFIYDYSVLESEGVFAGLVNLFANLIFLFLAPVTLLAFLWRFSDYQSYQMTFWHLILFGLDLWIILKFQVATGKRKITLLIPSIFLSALAILQFILVFYLVFDNSALRRFDDLLNACINQNMVKTDPMVVMDTPNNVIEEKKENIQRPKYINYLTELLEPRIIIDKNIQLTLDDKPMRVQMNMDGETDFVTWFKNKGHGQDLRGRSLVNADLVGADLRRAWLMDTKLDGANLFETQLDGADLSGASLQGASLKHANLKGVNFKDTKFQSADLSSSQLQGSKNLSQGQFQCADLSRAELPGAYIPTAQLQGADLTDANLQGSYLGDAALQGATLARTNLNGASLDHAHLKGFFYRKAEIGYRKPDQYIIQKSQIDFTTDANWVDLKKLSNHKKYQECIESKSKSSKNSQEPQKSPFVYDKNALADVLPILCSNGYDALEYSLALASSSKESLTLAGKRLPKVPECKQYLQKIKSPCCFTWEKGVFP